MKNDIKNIAKAFIIGLTGILFGGCESDLSSQKPYSELINTTWTLKTDAYLIEFHDDPGKYILVPCDKEFSMYLPYKNWEFNKQNIGLKDNSIRVVFGFKMGQKFTVIKVIKRYNPEMGDSYIPIANPLTFSNTYEYKDIELFLIYDVDSMNAKYIKAE